MYCNFNCGGYCNHCNNFVKTIDVKGTADRLDLIIPEKALCNCTPLCICVAQEIPAEVTKDTPVFIIVGSDEYPVVTPCINFIYGDQIKTGKIYCFKFGTDTLAFIYKGGWRLCRTAHQFTCVPIPTPKKKTSKQKIKEASNAYKENDE